jgi:LisH-like dimerisation domain
MADNKNHREMTIDSAEILRLIAAHLTECGLYEACRVLREESGVGSAGCLRAVHANFKTWASRGDWGTILESVSTLDQSRLPPASVSRLMADVHEMAILELAEAGEMRLAYAALRVVEDDLDKLPAEETSTCLENEIWNSDWRPWFL